MSIWIEYHTPDYRDFEVQYRDGHFRHRLKGSRKWEAGLPPLV